MKDLSHRPLFIFEMANNHMGSVEHGLRIVEAMREAVAGFPFAFAVKLQYRDIDTFIHPDYQKRFDLKFVKRFSETRLSWDEYKTIKDAIVDAGFWSICTPWDEISVAKIEEHGYDFIKIPSCYLTDWPLVEAIAKTHMPIIASTAGVALEDIDRVVSFFRHRDKPLSVMHCVGEYPTSDENLYLGQIRLLQKRYPGLEIGYSTHERPDNYEAVKVAIGMGARMFEKHVGVPTEAIKLNGYSANPQQVRNWIQSAADALRMCAGEDERYPFTSDEVKTLRALQRGVFVKQDVNQGERVEPGNIFYAIPNGDGQIVANDMSKYTDYYATEPIVAGQGASASNTRACDSQRKLRQIVGEVKKMLKKSKVVVPGQCELEVSHHYGIDNFGKFGSTVITVVNREYCKRVIVLLPGQCHPEQWHVQKDETYHILHGEINLNLDGVEQVKKANDVVIIPRGVKHGFTTRTGTVIEEVSSYYTQGDSFYTDETIEANRNRKTFVSYWMD
jgi:sialic acid synthase SpsE/quercetin dioxygenase-like cupin family protein